MMVPMKTRYLAWLVAAGALLGGTGRAADESTGQTREQTNPPAAVGGPEAPAKAAKRSLHHGMTAEEVIAMIGKPNKVAPMKDGDGKAEIWTYRRQTGTKTMQVPSRELNEGYSSRPSAATDGHALAYIDRPSMSYALETTTTYQVTSLLLYEGKLVTAKQWSEQEKSLSE